MLRLAGEVADGLHVHPLNNPIYLEQTVLPEVTAGAARAGRTRDDLTFIVPTFAAPTAEWREMARMQVGFYGSTPNYAFLFEQLGREGTTPKLREKQKAGDLAGMAAVIDDEILDHFCISGDWADLSDAIVERYAGHRRSPRDVLRRHGVAARSGLPRPVGRARPRRGRPDHLTRVPTPFDRPWACHMGACCWPRSSCCWRSMPTGGPPAGCRTNRRRPWGSPARADHQLVQEGHLAIDGGRIRLTGTRPTNPLLAVVLDNVAPHEGKKLKSRLGSVKHSGWPEVVDAMVDAGVIGRDKERLRPTRHPVVDEAAHASLLAEVRAAATGEDPMDPRIATLLALAGPCQAARGRGARSVRPGPGQAADRRGRRAGPCRRRRQARHRVDGGGRRRRRRRCVDRGGQQRLTALAMRAHCVVTAEPTGSLVHVAEV